MRGKKAQAAMEYLVTYSWAFIIILGAIGTLTYFDAFNPSKYMPDSCDFGEQLKCVDWFVGTDESTGSNDLVFRFRNNFEQDIRITNIVGDRIDDYPPPEMVLKAGQLAKVELTSSETIYVGDRESFTINITFNREDPSATTPAHSLIGKVSTKVADNSLGLV